MKKLFALSLTLVCLGLFALGCEPKPSAPSTPAPVTEPSATETPATDAAPAAEEKPAAEAAAPTEEKPAAEAEKLAQ